jgi:glutaredoxin
MGSVEELVCPHCKKVSYSASARAFSPCPHCKFRFAISEEEGRKYLVIDRQLGHLIEQYADTIDDGKEIEVIVDRREKQRPFSGVDGRKVTTNY